MKIEELEAVSQAILSIKIDKRPTKCFACLGNASLTLRERVFSHTTPGSLSRHFLKKHASKLQTGQYIDSRDCGTRLESRIRSLIHAERFIELFHGVR